MLDMLAAFFLQPLLRLRDLIPERIVLLHPGSQFVLSAPNLIFDGKMLVLSVFDRLHVRRHLALQFLVLHPVTHQSRETT